MGWVHADFTSGDRKCQNCRASRRYIAILKWVSGRVKRLRRRRRGADDKSGRPENRRLEQFVPRRSLTRLQNASRFANEPADANLSAVGRALFEFRQSPRFSTFLVDFLRHLNEIRVFCWREPCHNAFEISSFHCCAAGCAAHCLLPNMKKYARAAAFFDRICVVCDKNSQIVLRTDSKHFLRAFPVKVADLHPVDDEVVKV